MARLKPPKRRRPVAVDPGKSCPFKAGLLNSFKKGMTPTNGAPQAYEQKEKGLRVSRILFCSAVCGGFGGRGRCGLAGADALWASDGDLCDADPWFVNGPHG